MNVLLDFRLRVAGAGRYGRSLLSGFETISHDFKITVTEPGVGTSRLLRFPFTPWGRWHVAKRADEIGADLIHGLHFELPRTKTLSIVTIQDLIPIEYPASMPNPVNRKIFESIVRPSIERSSRIIVPSKITERSVLNFGAQANKVRIIPLGASNVFRPLTREERTSARHRFADGRRYVAFLEHSKPHKNVQVMQDVARVMEADAVLIGVGQNPLPGTNHIPTLPDSELRLFYGGSEAFVLPSLLEGFGLPALEALACGTPVVAGAGLGALSNIRAGVLEVDVKSSKEIANAVLGLLGDKDLQYRLSSRGLEIARKMTTSDMARATLAIYEEVLPKS